MATSRADRDPAEDQQLRAYLESNRDFLAPTVAAAVASLRIPDGGHVLDVGTGAGGALGPLARAVGAGGRVTAVDRDAAVLQLAREHVSAVASDFAARATFVAGDVVAILDEVAGTEGLDAIWAADVVWAGNVGDPAEAVRRLGGALRPGGVLALYFANYYQATFLPGRPHLERGIRAASQLRWRLPDSGPDHHDRHLAWLLAAGLTDVTLEILPRTAFPVPGDPAAVAYLEATVWPESRRSAVEAGAPAGMAPADIDDLMELTSPGSPRYVVHEPGYFVVHPTLLATGRRPEARLTR